MYVRLASVIDKLIMSVMGAQWLSGRMLDSRPMGGRFEPHRRQVRASQASLRCVLEQDTLILA